jgi:hypothetical protein
MNGLRKSSQPKTTDAEIRVLIICPVTDNFAYHF